MDYKSDERIKIESRYIEFIHKNINYGLEIQPLPFEDTNNEIKQRINLYLKEDKKIISDIEKLIKRFNQIEIDVCKLIIEINKTELDEQEIIKNISRLRIGKDILLQYINANHLDKLKITISSNRNIRNKTFYYLIDVLEASILFKIPIELNNNHSIYTQSTKPDLFIHLCFKFIKDKMREEELRAKLIDKNDVNTIKTKKKI